MKNLKAISNILRKLIEHSVWEKTFILRASKKKLLTMIEELNDQIKSVAEQESMQLEEQKTSKMDDSMTRVFVFLYQSRDTSLMGWSQVLKLISSTASGRPIYRDEADIKARLEAIKNSEEAGFFSVIVPKDMILKVPEDKILYDKNDIELISLESGAIKQENIEYFYYREQYFDYKNGQLLARGQ